MSAPEPRYVANADKAFTQACIDAGGGRANCGTDTGGRGTGLPWAMWVQVVLQPGDRVCPRCEWAELDAGQQEAALARDWGEALERNAGEQQGAML